MADFLQSELDESKVMLISKLDLKNLLVNGYWSINEG